MKSIIEREATFEYNSDWLIDWLLYGTSAKKGY